MKILNITTITEWRGGDAQMYTIYNLLKDKKDLKQFILCPSDSVLATTCERDKAEYFTYTWNHPRLFHCHMGSGAFEVCISSTCNLDLQG